MVSTLSMEVSPFNGPLYKQIAKQMKQLVECGVLKPGERLPSVRDLSRQLHVSTAVITAVIRQLKSEHIVETRRGSGAYVFGNLAQESEAQERDLSLPCEDLIGTGFNKTGQESDHQSGDDFIAQLRNNRAIMASLRSNFTWPAGQIDRQGLSDLRQSIAYWLRKTTSLSCDPHQIFVVAGKSQAYQLLAQLEQIRFPIEEGPDQFLCFDPPINLDFAPAGHQYDTKLSQIYIGTTSVWLPRRLAVQFVVLPEELRAEVLRFFVWRFPAGNALQQRIAACLLSCSKYERFLLKHIS